VWRDFKYPFHVKNLQIYMYNNLGWSVPIKSLPFWLRGIPAHAPFVAHYNAYGLIDSMEQQGWTIRYTSYTDMDNYDLPRRIILSRPGMDITIVLNHWDTLLLNRSVLPL
jgi:outer membrane lipoprotein LolB